MPTPGAPTISQDLEFYAKIIPVYWVTEDIPLIAGGTMLAFIIFWTIEGAFLGLIGGGAMFIAMTLFLMGMRKAYGSAFFYDFLASVGAQGDELGILGGTRTMRVFHPEPVGEWSGYRGGRRDLGMIDSYDVQFPPCGASPPLGRSGQGRVIGASVTQRLDAGDPVVRMLGRRRSQ